MNEHEAREKYRLDPTQLGQYIRGVDSMRRSDEKSEDFWDDVAIFFAKRFPASPKEQIAKAEWFTDIMKLIQRRGEKLIREGYIKSDEGTVSIHEDLAKALVSARLLNEKDEHGSLLDEKSVFEKLETS